MSDTYVTLSGNVTDEPRQYQFRDGSRVTSMRVAVNRRVLDQQTNTWQTRDTTFYTVRCYRSLADHVRQSIRKGHPVVVYGKLRVKQFERDGERRFWVEVEALSVGHDLKWGIASFEKPIRLSAGTPVDDDRQAMEDDTREWELAHAEAARTLGDGLRLLSDTGAGPWSAGTSDTAGSDRARSDMAGSDRARSDMAGSGPTATDTTWSARPGVVADRDSPADDNEESPWPARKRAA